MGFFKVFLGLILWGYFFELLGAISLSHNIAKKKK
jgi:hypothetical protein